MYRNPIINLLNAYDSEHIEERLYKQSMLDFAKQHEHCFERNHEIGHFTGSAWLLNKAGDKALLMHHRKLDIWVQLGGHADGETDLLKVSVKEAQEESGIQHIEPISTQIFDLDIHEFPQQGSQKRHFHYDVRFLMQVKSDEQIQINAESKELRWVGRNFKELPTRDLSVVRMFKKWLSR